MQHSVAATVSSRAWCAASVSSRHASNQRTVAFWNLDGPLQRNGTAPNRAQHLGPRRESVGLAHRRRKMKLTVPSLFRLSNQLELQRRHSETNQVPRQRFQRRKRHRQNHTQRLTCQPPRDDQTPGSPAVGVHGSDVASQGGGAGPSRDRYRRAR
jgi:hypothetical protein